MREMIKIDKNVPIPPKRGNISKYPWREMSVGDSFVVSVASKNTSVYDYARVLAYRANQTYSPRKFQNGEGPDGEWRIWRIA